MTAHAQALYENLSADMTTASRKMDAETGYTHAYRNAQAAYAEARDARAELLDAVDPEGAVAAADFQASHHFAALLA